ncbi:MAG: regulatory iron-sulfur-containing complex subunit RicT [Patescibacteria group bacterium]
MRVVLIQFIPWDRGYAFEPAGLDLSIGEIVVVNTEFGQEAGKVIGFGELSDEEIKELGGLKSVERIANREDTGAMKENNKPRKKEQAIDYCHKTVKRHGLEMKLVDCHFSFDDQRLTFAFIADGRVDFRNAVKDLTKHFQRSVRLHQLGVRDEAKIAGDVGSCGFGLCCRGHLKVLGNVTSELAEQQQVAHRGPERLSGVCGRLKCCLAYETGLYEELAKKLPPIGTRVRTKHGRGEVVGWHILKGSVTVKIDQEKEGERNMIVEVPIEK